MNPVIQEEISGCGIASAAAIAGISYQQARQVANSLGIHAEDEALWSDTGMIRRLLSRLGFETARNERRFQGWDKLPDCALLSIKWHLEQGKPYWHWVVFVRDADRQYVLDSKKALINNLRTDFGRMKPKWSIEVHL